MTMADRMIVMNAGVAEQIGTLVHLKSAAGQAITVRQDGAMPIPAEGDTVGLAWDQDVEMVFAADGRRVPGSA
jgi:sn-glycerol 3-phosphate transport system ATP-binding protein